MNVLKFFTDHYYKLIALDKVRFLFVGSMGFVVNLLCLAIFYDLLTLPIFFAQVFGAEIAMLSTFLGNNFWTFTDHHHLAIFPKLIKFHIGALMGMAINSTCVIVLVHSLNVFYGFALAIGSIAGLIWNYFAYKKFVFVKKTVEI